MKIIGVDNFNMDNVSDQLIAEHVNEFYGNAIIEFLNKKYVGDNSSIYFKLVEDNYKLYVWEP
jgi:hypothetical protein